MKVHLISIGGAVMHNLALELKRNGHTVTGSDDEVFEPSKSRLREAGLLPTEMGWKADRITADLDVVILGMHAREDNPELQRARELNLTIQSFPEFVAERSADKMRLVIAGSHGKTTTTAMVMHILQHQGMDFDYLVGSKLDGFELMVRLSDAPIIVIEGDEYLSSALDLNPKFLWYKPHVSVITGIAWDHINVFPTYEQYVHQFERFIDTLPEAAAVYYYGPDQDLSDLFQPDRSIIAEAYETPEFRVTDQGAVVTVNGHDYPMQVFGAHNFTNMQAAVRMVGELEISEEDAWTALSTFNGTARRLEKMNIPGILAYKDFAHSPSKVKATVEAVRSMYPEKYLVAALELHTFSSLNKDFIPHYKGTMNLADRAFVHYNPHVLQMKSMPDLPERYVQEQFGNVHVITNVEELKNQIVQQPPENAVYLFMSSGNWAGTDWVEVLRKRD